MTVNAPIFTINIFVKSASKRAREVTKIFYKALIAFCSTVFKAQTSNPLVSTIQPFSVCEVSNSTEPHNLMTYTGNVRMQNNLIGSLNSLQDLNVEYPDINWRKDKL